MLHILIIVSQTKPQYSAFEQEVRKLEVSVLFQLSVLWKQSVGWCYRPFSFKSWNGLVIQVQIPKGLPWDKFLVALNNITVETAAVCEGR